MRTISAGAASKPVQSWRETTFTVDHARSALPYLATIIDELVDAYRSVQRSRRALEIECKAMARQTLVARRDAAIRKLNETMDECDAVGVDLLDLHEGMIAFRCEAEGRSMSLLWRLGDPIRDAWVEFAAEGSCPCDCRRW